MIPNIANTDANARVSSYIACGNNSFKTHTKKLKARQHHCYILAFWLNVYVFKCVNLIIFCAGNLHILTSNIFNYQQMFECILRSLAIIYRIYPLRQAYKKRCKKVVFDDIQNHMLLILCRVLNTTHEMSCRR